MSFILDASEPGSLNDWARGTWRERRNFSGHIVCNLLKPVFIVVSQNCNRHREIYGLHTKLLLLSVDPANSMPCLCGCRTQHYDETTHTLAWPSTEQSTGSQSQSCSTYLSKIGRLLYLYASTCACRSVVLQLRIEVSRSPAPRGRAQNRLALQRNGEMLHSAQHSRTRHMRVCRYVLNGPVVDRFVGLPPRRPMFGAAECLPG